MRTNPKQLPEVRVSEPSDTSQNISQPFTVCCLDKEANPHIHGFHLSGLGKTADKCPAICGKKLGFGLLSSALSGILLFPSLKVHDAFCFKCVSLNHLHGNLHSQMGKQLSIISSCCQWSDTGLIWAGFVDTDFLSTYTHPSALPLGTGTVTFTARPQSMEVSS